MKLCYYVGRGEAIRLICADNGVQLEEESLTWETWPAMKPKTVSVFSPMFIATTAIELIIRIRIKLVHKLIIRIISTNLMKNMIVVKLSSKILLRFLGSPKRLYSD